MAPKNLAEIISECKDAAMKSPVISIPILDGLLIKWVGSVTSFAIGTIKATSCPYFSVSLFDQTDSIPCIFTEMNGRLPEILEMLDKPILITEPQFMIEMYVRDGNCKATLIHLFVEPDNVRLVSQDVNDLPGSTGQETAKGKRLSIIEIAKESNATKRDAKFHQDIAVLKVSSAMIFNKEIYCFALVTFIDSGEVKWLILKNNQVIWSNFLIPNRVYRIESATDIENSITNDLLPRIVDKIGDLSLIQMLHHRDWLLSYNAVFLRECCAMRLMPGNAPTTTIPQQWLSVSENIQHDSKFTNISGIVKKVTYRRGLKVNGCSLCDKVRNMLVNASKNMSTMNASTFDLYDPWRCVSYDRIPESGLLLPDLSEIKAMPTSFENLPFGVNKGKTEVEILLCDEKDGQNGVVYLKNWKAQHYPIGLVEGAVVCFTDVVRKISSKNNRYYINSPFTRVVLLKYSADYCERIFGMFGFGNAQLKRYDCEVWDALDMETLLRVDIAVRCRLCRQAMRGSLCRNNSCMNYDTENSRLLENYASASVQINGPPGAESVLITIKGQMVATYLEIPDDIWQALFDVASFSPINYHHKMETYSVENDPLLSYFLLYCRGYRQSSRFHISCHVSKGQQGDDDFYECTSIRKITEDRLTASALLVDNKSEIMSH